MSLVLQNPGKDWSLMDYEGVKINIIFVKEDGYLFVMGAPESRYRLVIFFNFIFVPVKQSGRLVCQSVCLSVCLSHFDFTGSTYSLNI